MGQLVEFPFGTGIDQRSRPEYVDGTQSWVALENVRCTKTGQADKRFGFETYDDGARATPSADRTDGLRHFMDGNAHQTIDSTGPYLDSYSPSGESVIRSRVPEATFRLKDLPTTSAQSTVEDVAYCNGYVATVSISQESALTYSISATIVDSKSGAVVLGPTSITTGLASLPYVAIGAYSTYFVLAVADTTALTVTTRYIDVSTAANVQAGWTTPGHTLTSNLRVPASLSVASGSDRVFFACNLASGTNRVQVDAYQIAGVVQTTTISTASANPLSVDIDVGDLNDTLWVTWNQTTAVKVAGLDPTNLSSTLATSATIITASNANNWPKICASNTTTGTARVLTVDLNTAYSTRTASVTISGGAATLSGSAARVPGVFPISRPFERGGRYYLMAQPGLATLSTTTQGVAILVDWTEQVTYWRPVCNIENGTAVSPWGQLYAGSKTVQDPNNTARYWAPLNLRRSSIGNSAQLVEYDFADAERWQPVVYNNSTYLSGGTLGYSDGRSFCEAGFLYRPQQVSQSQASTGLTISNGVRYVAVFESVDADGNLTISGVSDPSGAVTFSNKTNTISTCPCSISYRIGASLTLNTLRVAFYRTADNGGTPPYYRLAVVDNDTSSETVTYADIIADSTLIQNAKLYTEVGRAGAAQNRLAPPGLNQINVYNGMLVGANGRNVWYSGQPVIGEAAWFNPVFQVPIDGDGEVTALAVQDGALYVFKRRGIWVLTGEPPLDNGASTMSAPRRLAVDVGCISQRSVVVTSLGVFFQSERGIELLTRAQAVEFIGEYVMDETDARPYVMAATLDPIESVVYFELASSRIAGVAGGTGRGLVFDLNLKKWISTDRRYNALQAADAPAQSACMLYDSTTSTWGYSWMDTAGRVYLETSNYLDPGELWVKKRAESAWARSSIQGRMRVVRTSVIAKYATDSNQSLQLAYDYASSFQTAETYTRAEMAALAAGTGGAGTMPNIQIQHDPHDDGGECMAVRAGIEDATPTGGTVGTGRGALWYGLTFEVEPMEGGYLLPDGAR